jgi:hypothetical protein
MEVKQNMNDAINISELLKAFADNDYPITYKDGSHGRGMGYGDFEKLLNKLSKVSDKNGNWNEDSRDRT